MHSFEFQFNPNKMMDNNQASSTQLPKKPPSFTDLNDAEELVSPWTKPFAELKALMLPVSEFLYKRITRPGHKERGLVPNQARVVLRYSSYWEGEVAPFDSSLLSGPTYEFETGQQMVLVGLEAAVRTMYPSEQAEFVIAHQLLIREKGCPRADALFKIEVVDFTLIGDQLRFELVFSQAQNLHLYGKDCVKHDRYQLAVTTFEKAISSLNNCLLTNKQEKVKQTELLITLHQHLMICYNKMQRPQRVCIMMKAIRLLTNNQPSCKALFQEGRALASLCKYEPARKVFLQAQVKEPSNHQISLEILNLEQRIKNYKQASRDLWTRALTVDQRKPKELKELNPKFKEDCNDLLQTFAQSSMQTMGFSINKYSDKELTVLRQLAKERNMELRLSPIHEDLLTLVKMQVNSK